MTDGEFIVKDGQLKIEYAGRTVQTNAGSLFNELPSGITTTKAITFPDPPKGYAYTWQGEGQPGFDFNNLGSVIFLRRPQEYSTTINLGSAPAGTDFVRAMVKPTRTAAPSHSWFGGSIAVVCADGEWHAFTGSMNMEVGFGLWRSISIYLSGSDVILEVEQTVGPGGGGSRTWGDQDASDLFTGVSSHVEGWAIKVGGGAGIPVYLPGSSPYRKSSIDNNTGNLAKYSSHRWDGSDPCSTSDPTDYSTTWSLDIEIGFVNLS